MLQGESHLGRVTFARLHRCGCTPRIGMARGDRSHLGCGESSDAVLGTLSLSLGYQRELCRESLSPRENARTWDGGRLRQPPCHQQSRTSPREQCALRPRLNDPTAGETDPGAPDDAHRMSHAERHSRNLTSHWQDPPVTSSQPITPSAEPDYRRNVLGTSSRACERFERTLPPGASPPDTSAEDT